jgi:tetratricopeptide (TPR) repeat protein
MLEGYAALFGVGPELRVLYLLGLFDRPAEAAALAALRAAPEIPGLSEGVGAGGEATWKLAVARLRKARLVALGEGGGGGLDAHPLVREYFGARLARQLLEAWRQGNLRLYEHYRQVPEKVLPDTLEELLPLYAAVVHGCRAGRVKEALDEVYRPRIRRGNQAYSLRILGAFGAELTALAAFFDWTWERPSALLGQADRAWMLNTVGIVLRALGRPADAVAPMRAGLDARAKERAWTQAAISASNLSELTLTLGAVADAVAAGEECVRLADKSGDALRRMVSRATLADVLHQAGRREESAAAFRAAEAMEAERQPHNPRFYSLRGYQYCDLLLGGGEPEDGAGLDGVAGAAARRERCKVERYRQACEEVRGRATYALEIAQHRRWLLDVALDHLSLGRAHLGLALTSPAGAAGRDTAADHLDQAVAGLRQAGQEDDLPRGLLARAALRRLTGDPTGAAADLDEAEEIAGRGSMKLHLADVHLERTRLSLFQKDDPAAARKSYEEARRLVAETGYGRREREVRFLGERLGLTQR